MHSFEKLLDKAYETKTAVELMECPVAALAGVSENDAKLLLQAFNIKTIGDLATNKFFLAARQIADVAGRSSK